MRALLVPSLLLAACAGTPESSDGTDDAPTCGRSAVNRSVGTFATTVESTEEAFLESATMGDAVRGRRAFFWVLRSEGCVCDDADLTITGEVALKEPVRPVTLTPWLVQGDTLTTLPVVDTGESLTFGQDAPSLTSAFELTLLVELPSQGSEADDRAYAFETLGWVDLHASYTARETCDGS